MVAVKVPAGALVLQTTSITPAGSPFCSVRVVGFALNRLAFAPVKVTDEIVSGAFPVSLMVREALLPVVAPTFVVMVGIVPPGVGEEP
jgi:hypothetical protein